MKPVLESPSKRMVNTSPSSNNVSPRSTGEGAQAYLYLQGLSDGIQDADYGGAAGESRADKAFEGDGGLF
jgi:hypothetical protein